MLTAEQIRRLLAELAWNTAYCGTDVRLQRPAPGYSEDQELRRIQAELSTMLENRTRHRGDHE